MRWLFLAALVLAAAGLLAWRPAAGGTAAAGDACAVPPRDFPTTLAAAPSGTRPPLDVHVPRRLETATFALG